MMKRPLFSVFIVASLMVAIAHCFPEPGASRSADSSDDNNKGGLQPVIVLPAESPFSFSRPVIRIPDLSSFDDDMDDSLEGWNPIRTRLSSWRDSSLRGFLDAMQSVTDRIQEQMAAMMSGLMGPESIGLGGKLPEGGNTTSTTKIIDGHIVTINETTYTNNDNNSAVVFRVHSVDVKPLNQTTDSGSAEIETISTSVGTDSTSITDAKKTTEEPRSVETVEDTAGNEIPMKNEIDNLSA